MEILVAVFIFVVLFCLYIAIINSGHLPKHPGPIRIGDKGYDPDSPNHS